MELRSPLSDGSTVCAQPSMLNVHMQVGAAAEQKKKAEKEQQASGKPPGAPLAAPGLDGRRPAPQPASAELAALSRPSACCAVTAISPWQLQARAVQRALHVCHLTQATLASVAGH